MKQIEEGGLRMKRRQGKTPLDLKENAFDILEYCKAKLSTEHEYYTLFAKPIIVSVAHTNYAFIFCWSSASQVGKSKDTL